MVRFLILFNVQYFLGYKTVFFSFQNSPQTLDPYYFKSDLDLWDCLGRLNYSKIS